MRFIKRVGLVLLILISLGFIFRGWIYRNLVTYRTTGERKSYSVKEPLFLNYIISNSEIQQPGVEDLVKLSLKLTSWKLTFSSGENEKDPNKLISSKEANCIGYAAFFTAICNELLDKHRLYDWTAKPQIGQLYFLGTNIHPYLKSAFFRDHDFVTIENSSTGEVLAVDPSLNDYTKIDFVKLLKENQ